MENRNIESDISLVITRVLPFSREQIFRAWTEPEQMKKWFGPGEFTVPFAEADARTGGAYRIGMKPPDGGDVFYVGGVFQEFVPPEKLAFTWRWESEGPEGGKTLVTVQLRPQGDGTELTLTHQRFPSEEAKQHHNEGWLGCLDKLQKALAG